MERQMSQHSHDPKPEFPFARSARARAAQRLIPASAALAGLALLALASCGPDTGAGSEASSAPSAGPSAAAASRASLAGTRSSAPPASATAAMAAACPKVAPIHCPTTPATPNTAVQGAPTHLAATTATHANPLATGWSRASRRIWSRHRTVRHGEAYAARERRERRGESDRMQSERQDRFASAGSYESRQVTRSESTQVYGDERFAERGREVFRGEAYACPRACPGHRTFDYAGIDARGYLVWPGKVEY
jgi:hypothetical protein